MTFPTIAHIKTWNSARKTANMIRSFQRKSIGCGCHETSTGRAAIIVKAKWDNTICALDENGDYCEGAWCIKLRYFDDGTESWTSDNAIQITGDKYENIDAVLPLAVINGINWS